jgi:hypothetical protein
MFLAHYQSSMFSRRAILLLVAAGVAGLSALVFSDFPRSALANAEREATDLLARHARPAPLHPTLIFRAIDTAPGNLGAKTDLKQMAGPRGQPGGEWHATC